MDNKSENQKKFEEIRDRITFEFCRSTIVIFLMTCLIVSVVYNRNLIEMTENTMVSIIGLVLCIGSFYNAYHFSQKQDYLMKKHGVDLTDVENDDFDYSAYTFD